MGSPSRMLCRIYCSTKEFPSAKLSRSKRTAKIGSSMATRQMAGVSPPSVACWNTTFGIAPRRNAACEASLRFSSSSTSRVFGSGVSSVASSASRRSSASDFSGGAGAGVSSARRSGSETSLSSPRSRSRSDYVREGKQSHRETQQATTLLHHVDVLQLEAEVLLPQQLALLVDPERSLEHHCMSSSGESIRRALLKLPRCASQVAAFTQISSARG